MRNFQKTIKNRQDETNKMEERYYFLSMIGEQE
jgi:hypothetical protein